MKLSLIIPVYNVEQYVERCLKSCLMQNIDKSLYEIIIVNDGSTDRSLQIVKDIVNTHENVKIISQRNQGLSAARNRGLSIARGEYVWFVDSDDWIEKDCLNIIFEELNNNVDLLHLQYLLAYDDENRIKMVEGLFSKE